MFSNLQIRPAKPHRRKSSMATRSGVNKRRISQVMTSVSDIPSMSLMEDLFGEEFPEAFGSGGMKSSKSILDLPAELLAVICDELSRLDIKRLRLANRHLAKNVDLHIDRVYISPNRANLQCLRKIMDHPRYRFQVLEAVWDDAQLDEYLDLESFRDAVHADENDHQRRIEELLKNLMRSDSDDHEGYGAFEHDDMFDQAGRLTELAKGILLRHDDQIARDVIARNASVMSIEESYEMYEELYEEELEAIERGYDAAALRHVLANCPKLERIVLTSEVWRPWHFQPVYQTPFYRSLPPGYRKPSVWPWLGYCPHSTPTQAAYRDQIMRSTVLNEKASLPHEFRGYSIIVSALISTPNPRISEFIIYTGHEPIGISHQLFATPNADFTNTMTMTRIIPLKRLQLTLNSYGSVWDANTTDHYLRSGQIHAFLSALPLLEHLDLAPNSFPRRGDDRNISEAVFYPEAIIPRALLPRLKTFALRNVNVFFEELVDLIKAQTSSQHITLDNFRIDSIDGTKLTYYRLFRELWMHYDRHMDVTRPAFTVIECIEGNKSRMVCEELCEWLYNGDYETGNVFEDRVNKSIKDGVGWVVDDRDERFLVAARESEGWGTGMVG
jgi:hypothetical protein